jgi:hypothetical protein
MPESPLLQRGDHRFLDGTVARLRHFDRVGYVVLVTTLISMVAMYFVQKSVARQTAIERSDSASNIKGLGKVVPRKGLEPSRP